jgi:aminoglycoside phosphotransferase (APT) family kinase protein
LQRMHAAGWVHGDTHLGNFMLDANTWRVVAIDVVR